MPDLFQSVPLVDYSRIAYTADLQDISWVPTEGGDLGAVSDYYRTCATEHREPVLSTAKALAGNDLTHLRQTTLANGLVFHTAHRGDGQPCYNVWEYRGIQRSSGNRWHNADTPVTYIDTPDEKPIVITPTCITGVALPNGFMLTDVSVSNGCNFATWAIRKFSDDDSSTIVGYRLSASPNGENGLTFSYRVNTTHPDGPCKYTQVELTDMDPTLVCRVTEGYDSSLPASRAFLPDSKEEAVLTFLANGVFGSVHGVSQTNARNPDWTDDTLQRLLRRGSNEQFSYTADTADGAFLANEVFGIDASKHPRLNAQATLTTLMDLAIRGERMDLNRDLQFL